MSKDRYPYRFPLLYVLNFMGSSVYSSFIAIYLAHLGYNTTAIGSILAVSPFVALIVQPLWGVVSDRARTKNGVLKLLLVGSAATVIMYRFSANFYYLLAVTAAFTFFHAPVGALSDAITLEYLLPLGWKFGPVRMGGPLGYAAMAVIAGAFADRNPNSIFSLYFLITLMALGVVLGLPEVRGHQAHKEKVPVHLLFRIKPLVLLMAFNLVINITLSFYGAFFPLWYLSLGANSTLVGWAIFIANMSEIPFLLFADRVLKRLGTNRTLLAAACVAALRWLLYYLVTDPRLTLLLQVLHGGMVIVMSYTMAVYIDREIPRELKASGQTVYGAVSGSLARIVGLAFGGALSTAVGIRQVFLFNSLLVLAAAGAFGALLAWRNANGRRAA